MQEFLQYRRSESERLDSAVRRPLLLGKHEVRILRHLRIHQRESRGRNRDNVPRPRQHCERRRRAEAEYDRLLR